MMSFAVLAIVKATLVCGVAFFLSRAVPARACVDSTPAVRARVRGAGRHSRCRPGVAGCCGHGTSDSDGPGTANTRRGLGRAVERRRRPFRRPALLRSLEIAAPARSGDDRAGGHRHLAHQASRSS